jgi:hypothetical protein
MPTAHDAPILPVGLRPCIGRAQIASRDKPLVEGAAQGAAAQKAADAKAATKDASNKAADFATENLEHGFARAAYESVSSRPPDDNTRAR